jgi:hypothetical protein
MEDRKEILEMEESFKDTPRFKVNLSLDEKIKCLEEILGKLKKILYVYDKTQESNSEYNYKIFCGGILIYVSSSNLLFDGELVSIVVNINAILTNEFDKPQLKRIVFESINQVEYILSGYRKMLKKIENNGAETNSSNEGN